MKDIRARNIMNPSVVMLFNDQPVAEAARILDENGITGAPVVNRKGRLVGMLSSTDILATELKVGHVVITEHEAESLVSSSERREMREAGMHVEEYADLRVEDIMTPVVISAPPDATVAQMAELMGVNRIHRLLIAENERVLGVVSAFDLIGLIPDAQSPARSMAGLEPHPGGTILWATDLGLDQKHVGAHAVELARRLDARLIVLHVVPDLATLWRAYGERPEIFDVQKSLEERALDELNRLVKGLRDELPAVEVVSRVGNPARLILRFAEDLRPDCVVIGAQRPSGERIDGIGSVAERILARISVPVMTVPRPRPIVAPRGDREVR